MSIGKLVVVCAAALSGAVAYADFTLVNEHVKVVFDEKGCLSSIR